MSLIKPFKGIRPQKKFVKETSFPNINYINNYKKNKKFTRFIKSKLITTQNGKLEVELLPGQESFRINSFVKSNIWAVLPQGQTKFKKGQIVDCFFPNCPNKILD